MSVDTGHGRQMVKEVGKAAKDHIARYAWAAEWLKARGGIHIVLDGACGCGYGSMILAEAGFLVRAIDISPKAIKWAEEHFAHENITYVCQDLLETKPLLVDLDAVVSFETLEHLEAAPELVAIFRKLAPIILASTPNEDKYPFKSTKPVGHVRHYSPAQFDQLLAGSRTLAPMTQLGKAQDKVVVGRNGRFLVQAREWWDWEKDAAGPEAVAPPEEAGYVE